jgi:hypothetical protein
MLQVSAKVVSLTVFARSVVTKRIAALSLILLYLRSSVVNVYVG